MRINEIDLSHARELKRISKNPTYMDIPKSIIEKINNWGFELRGSGVYSSVWTKPNSNIVLKLSYNYDKCWLKFAEVAKNNYTSNPHFPKIGSINEINLDGSSYFFVFIEKLESININDKIYEVPYLFLTHALSDAIFNPQKTIKEIKSFWQNEYFHEKEKTRNLIENIPEALIEACQIVGKELSGNCEFDLGPNNFMLRENTLVITDPYAYPYS